MDKIIKNFILNNNLNLDKLRIMPEWEIYNIEEKNPLAYKYGIYKSKQMTTVSVSNIIGYEHKIKGNSKDLICNMENFFNEDGDSYHTRANGLLNYTCDNLLSEISVSLLTEPMVLNELDENYFISTNGYHRFHVMRIFLLNELLNISSEEEKNIINNKYKIPALVNSLDYIKTYCNFILSQLYPSFCLNNEYDLSFNKTGNSELKLASEKIIVTDEELINLTFMKLNQLNKKQLEKIKYEIKYYYDNLDSFKKFMDSYFNGFFKENRYKHNLLRRIKKKII